MKVLVTGASGFVGSELVQELVRRGEYDVRAAVRSAAPGDALADVEVCGVGDISDATDWRDALAGVDCVVHLAGRAHVLRESRRSPLQAFRTVNTAGTLTLAQQAARTGVKRFVFVSSIGVNGVQTTGAPFDEDSRCAPAAPYAVSKYEAEQGLRSLLRSHPMEWVIVRPPLVYAAHAPGNFGRLLKWVHRGVPLPLASVQNARSMVALENLVDFLITALAHPQAANQLFLVSDGWAVSTPQIVRHLAKGMGRASRLFPVPPALLWAGATAVGKRSLCQQLCGSLEVDDTKSHALLDWHPVMGPQQALVAAGCKYDASLEC